jgi:hypothetical protein
MTDKSGSGEIGDVIIIEDNRVFNFVGERAETGAKDDGNVNLVGENVSYIFACSVDFGVHENTSEYIFFQYNI